MTYPTTWKNLKYIILSEKSQTQKVTYYMLLFIYKKLQSQKTDHTVHQGLGEILTVKGHRISFENDIVHFLS